MKKYLTDNVALGLPDGECSCWGMVWQFLSPNHRVLVVRNGATGKMGSLHGTLNKIQRLGLLQEQGAGLRALRNKDSN